VGRGRLALELCAVIGGIVARLRYAIDGDGIRRLR